MATASLPVLQLMSRKSCCLCEEAIVCIEAVAKNIDLHLDVIDVDENLELAARYGADVPVLLMQGEVLMQHRVDMDVLEQSLKRKQGELQC